MARTRSSTSASGKKATRPKGKPKTPSPMKAAERIPGDSVEEEEQVITIGYNDTGPAAEVSTRPLSHESNRDESGSMAGFKEQHHGEGKDGRVHRRIAERAFILYLEGGCRHGSDLEHWFEAEREMKMRQE